MFRVSTEEPLPSEKLNLIQKLLNLDRFTHKNKIITGFIEDPYIQMPNQSKT